MSASQNVTTSLRLAAFVGGLLFWSARGFAAPSLEVTAARFGWSGGQSQVTARVSGVPAGRSLAVEVVIDGQQVTSVELRDGETRVQLPAGSLTAGRHEITLRSGSLSSTTSFRVLSRWLLVLPLAAFASLVALLYAAWRGRTRG